MDATILTELEALGLHPDPRKAFEGWYARAETECAYPEAMTLATVDAAGHPHARMVLFRGWSGQGLRFFTHYNSPKGEDLARTPRAALLFYWGELNRQVRVEGTVEKLDGAENDAYFMARDRESRIGAHASRQSAPLANHAALVAALDAAEARFQGAEPTRPETWGGYRVVPDAWEFWEGRLHRLHERFRFTPDGRGAWQARRLNP